MPPKIKYITPWQRAIQTGVCPYGHPIEECHKIRWNSAQQRFKHFCAFRQRETNLHGYHKRKYGKVITIPMITKRGPIWNHDHQKTLCHMELVCGHKVIYTRRAIEVNEINYPGDMWCEKCVEWKRVHRASNLFVDLPSWIYHELEVS